MIRQLESRLSKMENSSAKNNLEEDVKKLKAKSKTFEKNFKELNDFFSG